MAKLENPKHEAFAYHLAKGEKQAKAYVLAGYNDNASAASRLAASPIINSRVIELKKEISKRITEAMDRPNEETFGSLAEMGLTMEWVANSFKDIYTMALADGQYAAANSAVSNIQKLIEIEKDGTTEDEGEKEQLVNIKDVTAMLTAAKELTLAAAPESEEPIDITPADTVSPQQLLEIKNTGDDDDHAT